MQVLCAQDVVNGNEAKVRSSKRVTVKQLPFLNFFSWEKGTTITVFTPKS